MREIIFIRPDDWHCHLRDGTFLKRTVSDTRKQFKRAIVMPNLSPPITSVTEAQEYLSRINNYIPENCDFQPLMTLYLTENLSENDVRMAKNSGIITAYKLYPMNSTTNSEYGIKKIQSIYRALELLQKWDMPLLIHGEVADPETDIFDREKVFIDRHLNSMIQRFPELRMVFEHVSTKEAVDFVSDSSPYLAATVTPHHLLLNRNQLLLPQLNSHHYCLPVIKTEKDQKALIRAATSGNPKFFLGTDSAPHPQKNKESTCCPAGIYNAHTAVELYLEVFSRENALDHFEGFASHHGPQFYRLPVNTEKMCAIQKVWRVPQDLDFGAEKVVPFMANEVLHWRVECHE